MRVLIAVALLLSLLVTVFAVQNNAATTIKFLFWSVQGSSALVLMVTLVMGILVGVLLMFPGSVRNRLRFAELRRKLAALEQEDGSTLAEPPPAPEQPIPGSEHG